MTLEETINQCARVMAEKANQCCYRDEEYEASLFRFAKSLMREVAEAAKKER